MHRHLGAGALAIILDHCVGGFILRSCAVARHRRHRDVIGHADRAKSGRRKNIWHWSSRDLGVGVLAANAGLGQRRAAPHGFDEFLKRRWFCDGRFIGLADAGPIFLPGRE